MKEIKITHYSPENLETTIRVSGNTDSELNKKVKDVMKNFGWSKNHTEVTSERDEQTGKWYSV